MIHVHVHESYACVLTIVMFSVRLLLAALHHNENSCRGQRKKLSGDLEGEGLWRVAHRKYNNGNATVQEIKTPCTYGKLVLKYSTSS